MAIVKSAMLIMGLLLPTLLIAPTAQAAPAVTIKTSTASVASGATYRVSGKVSTAKVKRAVQLQMRTTLPGAKFKTVAKTNTSKKGAYVFKVTAPSVNYTTAYEVRVVALKNASTKLKKKWRSAGVSKSVPLTVTYTVPPTAIPNVCDPNKSGLESTQTSCIKQRAIERYSIPWEETRAALTNPAFRPYLADLANYMETGETAYTDEQWHTFLETYYPTSFRMLVISDADYVEYAYYVAGVGLAAAYGAFPMTDAEYAAFEASATLPAWKGEWTTLYTPAQDNVYNYGATATVYGTSFKLNANVTITPDDLFMVYVNGRWLLDPWGTD